MRSVLARGRRCLPARGPLRGDLHRDRELRRLRGHPFVPLGRADWPHPIGLPLPVRLLAGLRRARFGAVNAPLLAEGQGEAGEEEGIRTIKN